MALIDASYFIGDINLPNVDRAEVAELVSWFIQDHEPKFLRLVLGLELYNALKVGFIDLTDRTTASQRFKDLVEGKDYLHCGLLKKWEGLIQVQSISSTLKMKKSMVANYVYYWFIRNKVSDTTGTGEAISKKENATNASSDFKLSRAYNMIIPQVNMLLEFLNANAAIYPEWELGKWYVYQNAYQWRPTNPIF